jgi:hypothetical protein
MRRRFEFVRGRRALVQAAAPEYHARGSSDLVAVSPGLAGRASTLKNGRAAGTSTISDTRRFLITTTPVAPAPAAAPDPVAPASAPAPELPPVNTDLMGIAERGGLPPHNMELMSRSVKSGPPPASDIDREG